MTKVAFYPILDPTSLCQERLYDMTNKPLKH